MFDSIKSKLGFGGSDDDYGERGYDARYEDDSFDDGYDDAGRRYEPYTSVTTRPSRSSYSSSSPKLVSIDDVRTRTQVPESLQRDPLPPRRVTSASRYRGDRVTVDANGPAPSASAGASDASRSAAGRERSESLDSLFTATAAPTSASSFDPYEAYAGAGAAKHDPTRSLTVLRPVSYGEVERVAKSLKAGDAVVLALASTPDTLSKRVLDFSFGVASALDASVDCVADKVFVITRGAALTDAERASLRAKGVL